MNAQKRHLVPALASMLAAVLLLPATGFSQAAWPEKPVRILVSFPPGGSSDLVARLLAEKLSAGFDQNFIVENKPGAAGTVAASALKEATPDGYTFMLSNLTPFGVAPTRFPDTPYHPIDDFEHITYIGTVHLGLFASAETGFESLPSFVEQAASEPGSIEYGSSGVGSWGHIIAEQFNRETGAELLHIPYKGSGPMRLDFRAGVIPTIFDAVPQNLPAVEDGTATALAVTARERLDKLPDVPTFTELGYPIVAENWLGVSAPAGLPAEIRQRLDAALIEAMDSPDVAARFDTWGLIRSPMSGEAFESYVAEQLEAWAPLVEAVTE